MNIFNCYYAVSRHDIRHQLDVNNKYLLVVVSRGFQLSAFLDLCARRMRRNAVCTWQFRFQTANRHWQSAGFVSRHSGCSQ